MPTSRARLSVVFFTVLIDLIGFGIIMPIVPYVAQRFGAGGLGLGFLMGAFSGMQFVATAVLGRLSDRIGRRPVILATTVVNAAGYVLFAFAGSFELLLVARLVSGFASGNLSVAQAYVADITSVADRSKGMGMLGAAFGIGFIIGPALGGFAAHYGGHMAPALVAAGLSLANFVLAWRILSESLHADHRSRRPILDLPHLASVLRNPRLRPLMLVWFLAAFGFSGYTTMLPLHAGNEWGWRERDLGWLFTVIGIVAAVVQGWAFGRLARITGDRRLLIVGMFGMSLSVGAIPFIGTVAVLYAWTVVLAFTNSLFAPAATGMVSVLADPAEQGAVLGVAQSLAALGRLLGPETLGYGFDRAGPVSAFVAAGAILGLGALSALLVPGRDSGAPGSAPGG